MEPVWHYPKYTEVGPWDAVSDCYALNVDDTCTWACYYSDFPVVRIRDGTVTGWHNDIRGTSALAVAGSRVALFGGYGPDRDRLALAELSADRAEPAGEHRVVLPDGEPFPPGTRVIGQGACKVRDSVSAWRVAAGQWCRLGCLLAGGRVPHRVAVTV